MRCLDDYGALTDFGKSIELEYSRKDLAYLYIGLIHRKNAVFNVYGHGDIVREYTSALNNYLKAIELNPYNYEAIKEKEEVQIILQNIK